MRARRVLLCVCVYARACMCVCVRKENDGVRAGGGGWGKRSLLLPPSLSHFQPALNFDPCLGLQGLSGPVRGPPPGTSAQLSAQTRRTSPARREKSRQEKRAQQRGAAGTKIHKKCISGAARRRVCPACAVRGGAARLGSARLGSAPDRTGRRARCSNSGVPGKKLWRRRAEG